jgi:hypothetical protein
MDKIVINIAVDFAYTPGPRTKAEGKFSAEEFLEKHLYPKFDQAIKENRIIQVILDGTAGFATSFLEGSFGELVRKRSKKEVLDHMEFISNDEPYLLDEIRHYINNA